MDYKSKKKLNLQRHSDFIFFIKKNLQKKLPMSGKPHEYWICLMNYYLVGSKLFKFVADQANTDRSLNCYNIFMMISKVCLIQTICSPFSYAQYF